MRKSHWIIALFLTCTLGIGPVMGADAAPAADNAKLEQIKAAPADGQHKECPMHAGKKECDHKKCEHKHDDHHHGKAHEKCDHKARG